MGRLLDKVSRWLNRNGVPPAYLWTKERSPRTGAHLHALIHLPSFEMRSALAQFIVESGGFNPADDDATGCAVSITGGAFGMKTPRMQAGALRYVCKAIDLELGADLGIKPVANVLPIVGRQFGISHSIGPVARAAAGWPEMSDLADLRRHINP